MIAGFVMVTLAAASWGTWSLFLRPTDLSPFVTTPIVFLFMGLFALPFALAQRSRVVWDRATIVLLVAHIGFDVLNLITFFAALAETTVAIAVLCHYVAPIIIALAAPKIDGTRVPGTGPAAGLALVGLVVILEPWHAPAAGAVVGALLGFGSAFCYAGNVFALRRLTARIGPPRAMAYHSLIAAALVAPFAIGRTASITPGDVGLLGLGSATIGAVSGMVFAIGLQRIGSARSAVLTFAEPLVAVAVGVLVWDESLHASAVVGGAMVLGAGVHVARSARITGP